jgi:hypothetical protein
VRATRTNTYDDYATYISAHSPNGRHIVAATNAADDLLWAQVDSIGTRDSYRTYLDNYPRGRHAAEARDNIEDSAWRQIAGALTIDGLTDFISEFPGGRHVGEARIALDRLQQEADAAPLADSSAPATSPFPAPPAPAGALTGSLGGATDGIPRAAGLSGAPVPLPRPRPHFLETAGDDGSVPLPRARPKTLGSPQTALNPLGWLQGVFQPHNNTVENAH